MFVCIPVILHQKESTSTKKGSQKFEILFTYIFLKSYNPITGIDNIKMFSFSSRPSRGSMIPGLFG